MILSKISGYKVRERIINLTNRTLAFSNISKIPELNVMYLT